VPPPSSRSRSPRSVTLYKTGFKLQNIRNNLQDREEIIRDWRRVYNEKLHELYSSPRTGVIKSRRMSEAWCMASMGKEMGMQRFGGQT
jgi:vacuolar-type H+-ATPase subunit E/Vma4